MFGGDEVCSFAIICRHRPSFTSLMTVTRIGLLWHLSRAHTSNFEGTKAYPAEAFLKSDNTGCYHTAFLLLSLPSLGERSGVRVVRYDFSEPQAGKDICDHRIASMKSHIG